VTKLADPNGSYKIDLNAFFANADECQKKFPNFDGKVDSNTISAGNLPLCLVNLPVLKAHGSPCLFTCNSADISKFPVGLELDKCSLGSVSSAVCHLVPKGTTATLPIGS
jgi:hypothetical protein